MRAGQDLMEEGQEETGWKLVHGDVFRPPVLSGWLAVLVGTGVQAREIIKIKIILI